MLLDLGWDMAIVRLSTSLLYRHALGEEYRTIRSQNHASIDTQSRWALESSQAAQGDKTITEFRVPGVLTGLYQVSLFLGEDWLVGDLDFNTKGLLTNGDDHDSVRPSFRGTSDWFDCKLPFISLKKNRHYICSFLHLIQCHL